MNDNGANDNAANDNGANDNVGLVKLARTLRVPVERIAYLTDVPAAELTTFRAQIADMLFEALSRRLARIAAAARILPAPIIAKLVRLKPNALLTAGTAGVLEPAQAVDIAKRLPVGFLADVAAQLDARRGAGIIAELPTGTIVAVAEHLARQQDWITLGDLVGVVSDEAARATVAVLDGVALIHSARMVDDPEMLSRFAGLLSEAMIADMLDAVADHDLWEELRPVLAALPESATELAVAAAEKMPADRRERVLAEIAAA